MDTQIAQYVNQLLAVDGSASPHCDMVSSSVHQVHAPVPTELYHELKALAAVYQRDSNCVAGDLLTIALKETIEELPNDVKKHMHHLREEYEREHVTRTMESVEYDAGGT